MCVPTFAHGAVSGTAGKRNVNLERVERLALGGCSHPPVAKALCFLSVCFSRAELWVRHRVRSSPLNALFSGRHPPARAPWFPLVWPGAHACPSLLCSLDALGRFPSFIPTCPFHQPPSHQRCLFCPTLWKINLCTIDPSHS